MPGYASLILRRRFTDLALPGAAMSRAKQWLAGKASWADTTKTFTFPSTATLTFGYLEHEGDEERYLSSEFQYIAFDEATQFTERQVEFMFLRLRTTSEIPVPLRLRTASNPGGVGHGWFKRRYVQDRSRKPGVVFVPAKLDDHPDEAYKTGYRVSLAKMDDVRRRRYEDGDWDIAEGLAFQLDDTHVVPDMDIPEGWHRFESMDFGVANPTCVLAWAVDYDGNLIVFDSYYQGDTLVSDHAAAIEAKRALWWPPGQSPITYADPSMWARNGRQTRWGDPATDVTEFEEHGITGLVQANNHRRPGRSRVIEILKPDRSHRFPAWHPKAGQPGAPRFFVIGDRCPELVQQMQDAPLLAIDSGKTGAGEIVDPDWESDDGHAVAALRYGAMSRPAPSREKPPETFDPREEFMRRTRERLDQQASRPRQVANRSRYLA